MRDLKPFPGDLQGLLRVRKEFMTGVFRTSDQELSSIRVILRITTYMRIMGDLGVRGAEMGGFFRLKSKKWCNFVVVAVVFAKNMLDFLRYSHDFWSFLH